MALSTRKISVLLRDRGIWVDRGILIEYVGAAFLRDRIVTLTMRLVCILQIYLFDECIVYARTIKNK